MNGHQQPPAQADQFGQLELRTSFFPLQWGLFFVRPKIEINGHVQLGVWGRNLYDLPAGTHNLRVFMRYFFNNYGGMASCQAQIHPGHVTLVTYHAPMLILITGGEMKQVGARPIQQLAANYPR